MPNTELERTLLRIAAGSLQGPLRGLPAITGIRRDTVEEAATRLCDAGMLRVQGPPNQNSLLGRDFDEVSITPRGRQAIGRP